jgi:D-alanyl-D-alanine carboxypeptidase
VGEKTGEVLERLDGFVRALRGVYNVPGLALSLTDRERTIAVRVYGHADVERGLPVTPDTLFEIGSIGKSFTACCVLQLVEEGRLDLHEPVTTYLPWFSVRSIFDEPITLHHLLTHTSGLIRGADITSDSVFDVWALRETDTGSPPGASFWYSNVGYRVVGAVLEAVEGRSYADVVRARVLEPVGMAGSAPAIRGAIRDRLAVGYGPWPEDRPVLPTEPLTRAVWLETGTADGSIAANAADLAVYLRMLMNRGAAAGGRVLSEPSFELMAKRSFEVGPDEWYGYGLARVRRGERELLGHGGGMVGYVSSMFADVDAGFGAVVLVNGMDWNDFTEDVARYGLDLLRAAAARSDLPEPPATPDPAAVDGAEAYVGTYVCGEDRIGVEADGVHLAIVIDGRRVPLAQRQPGVFVVRHPDLDRFALSFERDPDGTVIAARHGSKRFVRQGLDLAAAPVPDPAWQAYVGHFQSSNPWLPHFRIVERAGRLYLSARAGSDIPLAPLGEAVFGVADAQLPERLRFDAVVDGEALRANLSGCDYYRAFTP